MRNPERLLEIQDVSAHKTLWLRPSDFPVEDFMFLNGNWMASNLLETAAQHCASVLFVEPE